MSNYFIAKGNLGLYKSLLSNSLSLLRKENCNVATAIVASRFLLQPFGDGYWKRLEKGKGRVLNTSHSLLYLKEFYEHFCDNKVESLYFTIFVMSTIESVLFCLNSSEASEASEADLVILDSYIEPFVLMVDSYLYYLDEDVLSLI